MDAPNVRRRVSAVWNYFDEEVFVVDGVNVRKAKCKRCGIFLSLGNGGIGHLHRHKQKHDKTDEQAAGHQAM